MADKMDSLFPSRKGSKKGGLAGIISLDQYRWRKVGQVLRRKLGDFAGDPVFSKEISRAQQMYLDGVDPDIVDENEDMIMERCFEWFIFDYVVDGGVTPIEIYAAQNTLSGMEKKLLDDWTGSRLSVFEVKEVDPGSGLSIEDVLLSRQVMVNNFDVAGNIEKGSIVYMRILRVGDEYEFSTGGFGLPPACAEPLLERIRVDAGKYASRRGTGRFFLEKYLRERAHLINSWVLDLAHRSYSTGFDHDEEVLSDGFSDLRDKMSRKIAQQITDAFLDDYYERWINQPQQALDGNTPKESVRTVHGRAKLEELLKELEKMEKKRARKGEPHYDIEKVRSRLGLLNRESATTSDPDRVQVKGGQGIVEDFSWPDRKCARIALLLNDRLKIKEYAVERVNGAIKLWFDYCVKVKPIIRKEHLWVAAVEYAMARIECDHAVSQRKLAEEFSINSSSLSEKFRLLCSSLNLTVFDSRYFSGKTAIDGLELYDPVLAGIFYDLKL
ncbi:MAG: hypothetical protein JL50_12835 [Peptococcaceae bacterium BICA1-7]|nr:MAG: hypothetical protein JL50_12835 [Peptococcaceae bacterium BICA1-7]HBV97285.1 DUF2384 domain-containing protein [Desulfotomaculum sp.]